MPRHDPSPTGRGGRPGGAPPARTPAPVPDPLHHQPPAESLTRLADLIASGRTPWPEGVSGEDARRLQDLVRHRLRARLLRFLARLIARDLDRDGPPQMR
jgi:hypothetical protein